MTIHHDKSAYGKLASLNEEMSEEKILKMIEQLEKENKREQESEKENKDK